MAASYRDWPDGRAHSIPYAQHLQNVAFAGAAQRTGGMGSAAALRAVAAGNAAAGGGAPAAAAAPAAPRVPSPLDSVFTSGVAGLISTNRNSRDALTTQGAQATQDFNTMLGRLAEGRTNDLLATNTGANNQGLFYSGQLGRRRDDVSRSYDNQQTDQQTAYDRARAAREAALAQLGTIVADPNSPTGYSATGQAGVDLSSLYGGAVGRQTTSDAGGGGDLAAAQYTPLAITSPVVADDSGPSATFSGPQSGGTAIKIAASAAHGGAKWVYHRAANGTWIPVRPA